MNCPACGAKLGTADSHCAYCGALTPYGGSLQQQRDQLAAHREALDTQRQNAEAWQRSQDAKASLERTSKHALIWSGAGIVLCCAFFPSIVGIVMALRARKMAKKYSLVLPTNATLGLILGLAGVLFGAGLITIGVIEGIKRDDRIKAIDQQVGAAGAEERLRQPIACLLAERRLLQGAFGGSKNVDDFECDGRLKQDGDQATLTGVRFERSGDAFTINACLERGARWSVTSFRLNASCSEPDDTVDVGSKKGKAGGEKAPPQPSAAPSAKPAPDQGSGGAASKK